MKQTDILRRERELKRTIKKEIRLSRAGGGDTPSVGEYISELSSLFFHDGTKIYNINRDDKILDLLEQLAQDHPKSSGITFFEKR